MKKVMTVEPTYGERLVRLDLDPLGQPEIRFLKMLTASIIDRVDDYRELDPRLAAFAIKAYEEACMWAVKLATTSPAPGRANAPGQENPPTKETTP